MFNYDDKQIFELANRLDFNKNVLEKVLRLLQILEFLNNGELKNMLALKGGTAINLCLLDLPRLSVDIDMDFCLPLDKESMYDKRRIIDDMIKKYMNAEGYILSEKSKFTHSLDSYVYKYKSIFQSNDIIKIEINYSNRVHVLKMIESNVSGKLDVNCNIRRLADAELIGTKINAMLLRTTPRDVYDVYNLLNAEKIIDIELIKKITIFYALLSAEIPIDFNDIVNNAIDKIQKMDFHLLKITLLPLLDRDNKLDINKMIDFVINKIRQIFLLNDDEIQYIENFNKKIYMPNILFKNYIVEDLDNHPMALWKIKTQISDSEIEKALDEADLQAKKTKKRLSHKQVFSKITSHLNVI